MLILHVRCYLYSFPSPGEWTGVPMIYIFKIFNCLSIVPVCYAKCNKHSTMVIAKIKKNAKVIILRYTTLRHNGLREVIHTFPLGTM